MSKRCKWFNGRLSPNLFCSLEKDKNITHWVTFKCTIMDISFGTRRLQKIFTKPGGLRRAYGTRNEAIKARLIVLDKAPNLSRVPTITPERRHQLKGDRKGQFAVDLVHPYRLIFEADHEPVPRKDDGGIDVEQVTAITILEVSDYH